MSAKQSTTPKIRIDGDKRRKKTKMEGKDSSKLRELDITGFIQLIEYALLAVPKT